MNSLLNKIATKLAALLPDTQAEREERFLAAAVDHADLENRLRTQASSYLALYPAGSGR